MKQSIVHSLQSIVLFLLLAGTSCQQEPFEYVIQRELQPYVESFYQAGGDRGVILQRENLIMMIVVDLQKEGAWGLSKKRAGQRIVYIDQELFDDYTINTNHTDRIEWLVFHELGHSFLNRSHTDGFSIMNPKFYDFKGQREELLDELFNP